MFTIVWVSSIHVHYSLGLSIYLSIYPSLTSTDNSTRFNLPQDGLPSRDDWLQCFESMIFSGINLNREPIDGCVPLPEGQGLSWGGYKWLESQIYFPKKMFSSTMLVQKKMLFRDQPPWKGSWSIQERSVDIIKGWTRCTCVATILAACAELDFGEGNTESLLGPLHHVLDRCWLVPVHATCFELI